MAERSKIVKNDRRRRIVAQRKVAMAIKNAREMALLPIRGPSAEHRVTTRRHRSVRARQCR